MKKYNLIIILSIIFFSSCFKEDQIVPAHEQGDLQTAEIVLGEYYSNQIFYDLKTNSIITSNIISDWDLAFECKENSWHIILNAAQMMYAGNTNDTVFENITSASGVEMFFDNSNGNLDSTAIGSWYYMQNNITKSYNYIYIIDRGMDENFASLGKKKIQIDIVDDYYVLKYSDLNGENQNTIEIPKNENFKYVYFSFDDNAVVNIAPEKDKWSLKFSKYSTMLITNEGDFYPYIVTGVLLNPEKVVVALDTNEFLNISIADTSNYNFTNKMDFIGYEWKYYNFDDAVYSIVPNQNYIIKNYDGLFYKMRIISFYDNEGTKGTLQIEVVKL